ncbi:hypothetical protein E4U41_005088 [Claviceps citrina]|nr:hypothetical protein E4U41_005088 [Claviceps citrina]
MPGPGIIFIHNPRNDVDKQINAKLVEIWNTKAMTWAPKMRNEFKEIAAAARVTQATTNVSAHKIHRRISGRPATMAEYTVLAVVFGTAALRRFSWMKDLERKHPRLEWHTGIVTLEVKKELSIQACRKRAGQSTRTSEQSLQSAFNQGGKKGNNESMEGRKLQAEPKQTFTTTNPVSSTPLGIQFPETTSSGAGTVAGAQITMEKDLEKSQLEPEFMQSVMQAKAEARAGHQASVVKLEDMQTQARRQNILLVESVEKSP